MTNSSQIKTNLSSEEKRTLLKQLLRKKTAQRNSYPLSYGQQALWFLHQSAPESAAYNIASAARLLFKVNVEALRRACQALINRHPSLRTTFTKLDGKPVQEVHEYQEVWFEETDASTWTGDELNKRVREAYLHPFDLKRGPVLRVNLFTRTEQEHILLLTIHHIVFDAWSVGILIDELQQLLHSENAGTPASLPPLERTYADYVHWQSEMLAGPEGERLWAYWRKQLAGDLPVLNLPTDRPRPPVQTDHGASYTFKLSVELTQRLKELVQIEGATLYMVLMAAFQVLLHRYTGQEDILVGSPTTGRNQTEFIDIVGYFVNVIVLRAELSDNPTFKTFLSQVRHTVLAALAHQDYPFPLLVDRSSPKRDPSYSPIFQASFFLQKPPRFENLVDMLVPGETETRVNWGGFEVAPFELAQQEGQFDLILEMVEARKSLVGVFKYNTDLFDETTIARMVGHFQTLLDSIVANPEQRLSELPLLTKTEQQLLVAWNDTQTEYPQDKCIHQLFEAQVERTPEALAVVFEEQQLTYRDLNQKANQLAHYLLSLDVKPEVLVGLCVERSLDMVIGLLGILKAGGAYLPLEPAYPTTRLAFMLEEAGVPVLLTQSSLVEELPSTTAAVVCLDTESFSPFSTDNPVSGVSSDNLAYVIYTSGSTGQPKGVLVEHKGLCNLAQAQIQKFGVQSGSRLLQFVSLSFDVAISDLVTTWCSGATLYLVNQDVLLSPTGLIRVLNDQSITHLEIPASVLGVFPAAELPALQSLIVGGETCSAALVAQWSKERRFFNVYGPTEATVCTTIAEQCQTGQGKPPIGRPIANTQVHILDDQPVPIGVPGEIHIGGVGLARGYLNRPELTQEKFIPNPFSNDPNSRLYKTGDLARYLPDGNIEFLGRIDNQVKIRGFRIELGEIEAVLTTHPKIRECVVIVHEASQTDKRLLAYLVPHQEQIIEKTELRRFLKERLPDYMIPSAFVTLEALPLTPNGKIDRRALAQLSVDSWKDSEESFVLPRTPEEEVLAAIWADVLGVERVGIHDNFFELGGHSLLATQVMSRIRDTFSVDLPLHHLFESPTILGLSEHLNAARRDEQPPQITPLNRDKPLPLSFAQQRLWFLDQLEGENATYNIPLTLRLDGKLNRVALEQSLRELMQRHETLRTTFSKVNGKPVQLIHPLSAISYQLSVIDLQELPPEEQSTEGLVNENAGCPFDLSKGPLFRTMLLQLSSESHVLLVNMHHIISDGWSMEIIIRELLTLYEAFSQGQPSPLPPLPIQYADFAYWQRQWLTGEPLKKQLHYWQQQLTGAPALLELPTDRPRPPIQRFIGTTEHLQITPDITARLKHLSQRTGTTLFMTLLSAFATLLSRYSGTSDIVIGSPIANRTHSQLESLIGFFVNTLVLRIDLESNPRFNELLQRVRRVALDAYAHQDLPFEQLVEEIHPERNLSHTPLFQVMFVLQNASMETLELSSGLTLTPSVPESIIAKFDLTLSMAETDQGLKGIIEYNTDLFDNATIRRMVGHFQTLLEGIVANPRQHIQELPLLTAIEHQQLMAWNDTAVDYPQDQCIHQLFEAQVERTPDAIAVVFEDQQLTYRDLNQKANQLAHYLLSLDVKPEVLVGLCVERSLDMVIGLLGILKAGGAYLPLEPAYPTTRLAFMLEEAGVPVLLTQSSLVEELPSTTAAVVCLDTESFSPFSTDNPVSGVSSDNLAYVIYTSGSTGQPKGVLVEHKGLCNLAQAQIQKFGVQSGSRLLQFVSLSFDVAISDLVTTWCSGATLYLVNQDVLLSPTGLIRVLNDQSITHLEIPASVLGVFPAAELPALQSLIVGGETCSAALVAQWSKERRFFNVYGPTEATVCTTIAEQCQTGQGKPPIGRPIANTQVHILDDQPVPIGVPGEIHIGGVGLARGYLNRPELTQEKFIPNPFSNDPNSRLYKTGDLARYLPDGNIEFLGRIDNQVKIRGFRIELGEIEAVLTTHPKIRECVVIVHEASQTDKRLLAYLVPHQEQIIEKTELRRFLKERLPDYMIPSAFVTLEALPLTPNGKIDRRALAQLSVNSYQLSEESFVLPRTPEEEVLAAIWADVLGIERVGVHDNFFELGGHSLLATQVMSRVRETFSVDLPLRVLFELPTIAGLCEHLLTARREEPLPPITPVNRDEPLPLSFAQQRLWFLAQLEGESATYNMPAALRLEGPLDQEALEQSLRELVKRHDSLHTRFPSKQGQPSQEIEPAENWKLTVTDLQGWPQQNSEVQRLIKENAQHSFDLSNGPLFRCQLLKLGAQLHVLLINMHHIISDGWSIGIFIRESQTLYQAFSQGQASPLPPLPIQYVDFAHWQRQWLSGERLERQSAYWKKQLAGAPTLLELPTDHPRPPIQSFRGAQVNFTLNTELTESLNRLSQTAGTTLFMTLLSAFATLLSRYTGQTDIVVGSAIANRTNSQIESLIGFFVNTLVLRIDLSDNPHFQAVLQRVRTVALEAYAHQDIPFEQLVEEIQPERNLSHTPLFQVMFDLQNAPMETLALSGLQLKFIAPENAIAKFDLTCSMEETPKGLAGTLEYNTDLFEPATIERMAGHFTTLLEGIVVSPEQRLSELPLLTVAEQQQLRAWNDTVADYPSEHCVHQLFEAQVEKTPDAIAVVFEDQQLTYRELNQKANQLAHQLQTVGVKPEVLVGICVERSLDMVIGLLGILKAGGGYLPLDISYPSARLAFMLEDAQVPILLTQTSLKYQLPETSALVVFLDAHGKAGPDNPVSEVKLENLAYVIYTSGSTGQSKGVIITHRSLVNAYHAWEDAYQLSTLTTHLQMANFSFDVFTGDLVRVLCSGSKLVLCPQEWLLEPEKLYQLMREEQVDCAEFVPAVFRNLIQYLESTAHNINFLKLLVVGSDSWYVQEYQEVRRFCSPSTRLINSYGISEATIDNSYFENTQINLSVDGLVPIGHPFANTQIYILDHHQKPVPIGVHGELYIGGVGLARGYLNRPELTQEKFIPNPFSNDPNSRLYKTGDLARYLPDGNIEFLGRIDNQVKIRGFRIELGEIEAVLGQHPTVRENTVLVHERSQTDKRLVAYLVPPQEQVIENTELRAFLKERLPDYMIPSAFVTLEALPLTPNGKIDRRALAQLSVDSYQLSEKSIVLTPEEELLAGIWADVLGVKRVGVHDNFFEMGGHSLLATQVISRVRETFSVDLPLRLMFESPTIAGLCEHLLKARREEPLPPITPVNRDERLPLSFAQQRLWFLAQLEGESATYNMPAALRLEGPLDQEALEQSLRELVKRHDSLHTRFPSKQGQPSQEIEPAENWKLTVTDLQGWPQQNSEVQRLIKENAQHSFDLSNGPLFRCQLLKLGAQLHVLLINMHHIISDGWSIGIFIRESQILYQAFSQGQASPLPPLPIQYVDFAHWQRQWLSGERLERQSAYWKKQLAGAPTLLELPTDHPRPPVQSFRGAQVNFTLNTELTESLNRLSQTAGTTLFMTLLSAFATLLSRYTGQTDIVVGSAIANRTIYQIESLIGFFVNTLVLRIDFSKNPHFETLLQHVRTVALEAYAHQDIPFEQLVEEIQPERNLSHTPLFQVMFVLQNAPMGTMELSGLQLKYLAPESAIAKFDLTCSMEETPEGLTGALEYNTDLFERATIERMAGHLTTLLEGIVVSPKQRLSELPLLTMAEQQQLRDWNDTVVDYPSELCVHQLFEAQVEKTPDAIAVVFEDKQLTYRVLNTKANSLAYHLRSLGVKPELLVGIFVERSLDMVVGLLAILKAGGVYVPLETSHPKEYLALMLEDSQVPVLITQENLIRRLPSHTARVVCLDGSENYVMEHNCEANPVAGTTAENLAYVSYTSGSTGQPKGVCIIHQSVIRLVKNTNYASLTADQTFLQLAPLAFDASTLEIWGALLNGAKLVIMPPHTPSLEELGRVIGQHQITTLWLTAGLFHLMVSERLEDLRPVRQLLAGGDVLSVSHVRKILQELKDCQLINGYGPTENTTFTCCFSITDESQLARSVPIGRPITNTQVYILDAFLHSVPVGVPGELYIGGAGLARGYLNNPELTAEKFIPHLFNNDPKSRLYKTGDLARYLPDGNIEFLGRIDNQVKIRGFQIELGEIEAVLATHPGVRECAAIVHEEQNNKRLVAYWVSEPEQSVEQTQLRDFIKERIPDYMVPNVWVPIDQMPLTPNGKIDRKALAQFSADSYLSSEEKFVAPRDKLELQLTQIWEEILNVHPIGVRDNFFDLGGHSLLVIRLMSHIERHLGKKLPLATLFQAATIENLAIQITQQIDKELPWSPILAIQPKGSKPPLFVAPPGSGHAMIYIELARYLGADQPFYGLQALGLEEGQEPHTQIEDIAAFFIKALQTIQPQGPYRIAGWSFGGLVAFEMAQQLQAQGQQVAFLALLDTWVPSLSKEERPESDDVKVDEVDVLMEIFINDISFSLEDVRQLEPDKQLSYVIEQCQRLDLLPPNFWREQAHRFLQVAEALAQAGQHYQPQLYRGKITFFQASEKIAEAVDDPSLGWDRLATEGVEVHQVPGNHRNMVRIPHAQVLAEKLKVCLEQLYIPHGHNLRFACHFDQREKS
jgi:amino acid adenylation domain-containing protein